MRILLVNYRYFISGGPERYLFNFIDLFKRKGHKSIPFSVKHPRNQRSEYSKFFLSPLYNSANSIAFKQLRFNPSVIIKLFDRNLYSIEAIKKIRLLLKKTKVDAAYILLFYRWISPSIITKLKKNKIPIFIRISDFEYICPEAHLLRRGRPCELCIDGNYWHAVKNKCIQDSYTLSFLHALSLWIYKKMRIMEKTDAFICPSKFTLNKLAEVGFDEKKLFHIPTFIDSDKIMPKYIQGDYILYFGRLSPEKGVNVLLDAYKKFRMKIGDLSVPLIIVCSSNHDEIENLRKRIHLNNICGVKIIQECGKNKLYELIKNSAFSVVPSVWYENMPNVILESFACGKPVIGSQIGSIPELVKNGKTGLLFECGASDSLAEKMIWLYENPQECERMGRRARQLAEDEYNPELHYRRLIKVFNSALSQ